jgi:hypothetical protein
MASTNRLFAWIGWRVLVLFFVGLLLAAALAIDRYQHVDAQTITTLGDAFERLGPPTQVALAGETGPRRAWRVEEVRRWVAAQVSEGKVSGQFELTWELQHWFSRQTITIRFDLPGSSSLAVLPPPLRLFASLEYSGV